MEFGESPSNRQVGRSAAPAYISIFGFFIRYSGRIADELSANQNQEVNKSSCELGAGGTGELGGCGKAVQQQQRI